MSSEEKLREESPPATADEAPPTRERMPIAAALFSPRMLVGVILIYAGIGAYFLLRSDLPLSIQLERYGSLIIAFGLGLVGFYLVTSELAKRRAITEARFIDVDERSRATRTSTDYESLLYRLQEVQANLQTQRRSEPMKQEDVPPSPHGQPNAAESEFRSYFESIRRLLEEKASVADEKASILLDKGTSYSRFGIVLFILSIVGWQVIAHLNGFHVQYIYGIVSTSLLFVFIEFLSAWFLKQYRQFIDTSTYLIKVKSIFDRYMLVYLASREAIQNGHDTKKSNHLLLDLLRSDISWPDTYLTKNPDISFAREALETMSLLVKSMKSEAKEAASKDASAARKAKAAT